MKHIVGKLSIGMIARDSLYGPMFRRAKTKEELERVCEMAQEEWDSLLRRNGDNSRCRFSA